MTFGERLIHYRMKKHLTQKALAEKLEITPTRLNYWEKDKRQPDVEMIRLLAKVLDVSADILIGYKEDPELQAETKKAPAPEGTEEREQGIDNVEDKLRSVLLDLGLAPSGELTPDQLEFLSHIVALIQAYFKK